MEDNKLYREVLEVLQGEMSDGDKLDWLLDHTMLVHNHFHNEDALPEEYTDGELNDLIEAYCLQKLEESKND